MENRNLLIIAGASILAAIALGVVAKGLSEPAVIQATAPVAPTTTADALTNPATPAKTSDERKPPEAPTAGLTLQKTPSGLQYADIVVGSGESPVKGSILEIDFTGWTQADGKMYDTSLKRRAPVKVPLGTGQIMPGWDEGLATMKAGGKRQLVIPPDLAYGSTGKPGKVPPNATVIYEMTLVSIAPPRPAAPEKPTKLADKDFVTTASGLKYHDIAIGTGPKAAKGDKVQVEYTGWLVSGDKFDSSYDRNGPLVFGIGDGSMIQGMDEGVTSMQVGGKRQVISPYALAYGEKGRAPLIPPKATLVFELELVGLQ